MKTRKRKLTPFQKFLREKYTRLDRSNNVWLMIDHQSFQMKTWPTESKTESKIVSEWRRDQIAIALERMNQKMHWLEWHDGKSKQ